MLKQDPPQTAGPSELTAGLAVIDITPPIGYRLSGYFNERISTGIKNPLKAKALILRQGAQQAALVFCDIIGLSLDVSSQTRRQASQITGIPEENILLAATHSHTGPLYCGALREHFHNQALAEHGSDPCEQVDYPAELVQKLVKVITAAHEKLTPIRLTAGSAQQQGLSFNRRFHMKDGTILFNPGLQNPDIVKTVGTTDPGIGIVFLTDVAKDKPIAGLINFALHLDTVGSTEYAADYPFYLERSLREVHGDDFVLLFGNGTCGDLNHLDVTKPAEECLKTEYIGTTLAETVKAKYKSLSSITQPALAIRREIVHVPIQKYTPEQLTWARRTIKQVGSEEVPFLEQVEAYKILELELRGGDTIPIEVQVFRLGPMVAVVALPGEVFVDLGLAIKRASPFPVTLVIELCHDDLGYLPTQKAFAEGSYETVNSRIAPGGGELMVDAALRLLNDLGLS